MKFLLLLLVLLPIASCNEVCPLWFNYNSTEETCQCGDDLRGVVYCDSKREKVSLQFFYCMTFSNNETIVGPCFSHCHNKFNCGHLNELQSNSTKSINEEMCGKFNRRSQLCGSCDTQYSLPAYSYSPYCVRCEKSDFGQNIKQFILITFLPLTVLYLLVIIFKISVTSGYMVAYVMCCQIITMPVILRSIIVANHNKLPMSFFTVWNLDIFRSISTPFCIHPKMNILHVLALDYLVGIYPLFLIFITYLAILLHDRYPIVVKLWKPGYRFFKFLRSEWDLRGSLVKAFATFIVLSYIKLLNTSFDYLTPVKIRNSYGESLKDLYLFANADIKLFGTQHLPYAIIALVMLTVFNILPMLLLLLYQCHCFRKCLGMCGVNSLALSTFMDAFQGCYQHHPDISQVSIW